MTSAAHHRRAGRACAALALAAATLTLPSTTATADEAAALVGGEAIGQGIFATYFDQDTVIEGGTVAAPDFSSPLARAALDRTGLGSGLASLGYSPYNDAAGVINAFAGTSLPMDSFSEASRAKVTGRPPQDQEAAAPGPPGSVARAKLSEGPTAEAIAVAMATPAGAPFTVRIGDVQSTVRRAGSTVGSVVTVILRDVTIGEALVIKTIRLTSSATADGGAGAAEASSVVEGVTVGGQAVRFTPEGLEPVGAPAPDLSGLAAAGIEIVSAGEAASAPGGQQSEARATGPRFQFRTPDGRTLILILGQAVASSTFTPPGS